MRAGTLLRKLVVVVMLAAAALLPLLARAPEVSPAAGLPLPPALRGSALRTSLGELDLSRKPALFFGPAGCEEALRAARVLPPERRPYLVALCGGFPELRAALRRAGLDAEPVFCLGEPPADTAPTLLVLEGGRPVRYTCSAAAERLHELRYPVLLGAAEIPLPATPGGENALLAGKLLSGAVVAPGGVFSFYGRLGEPTTERGFLPGRTLVETPDGPKWVEDVGGGICIAATALHLAVKDAGLEEVERHAHTRPVSYAPPGEDAAVARSSGWDYRFRNNLERPVKVVFAEKKSALRAEVWALRKS